MRADDIRPYIILIIFTNQFAIHTLSHFVTTSTKTIFCFLFYIAKSATLSEGIETLCEKILR